MGKKKGALAIGLCLAVGLCGAGLTACGGKGGGSSAPKAGDKSDYYLAGEFKYADYEAANDGDPNRWQANGTTRSAVKDEFSLRYTDTANVFEVTINLYEGDEFGIVIVGAGNDGWEGQMGMAYIDTTNEYFVSGGGYDAGNKNISINQDGKYTITLTIGADESKKITCERIDDVPPLPVPVSSITLNKSKVVLELNVTTTFQLEATINPENADDKDHVYYDSDDTDVATVSETGLITAVGKGTAKISVECGGVIVRCAVKVLEEGETIPATAVELSKTSTTLHVGQTETLTATPTPDDTTDEAAWASSKTGVATVADGKITAVAPGDSDITVTYGEADAKCAVTVAKDFYLAGSSSTPGLAGWAAKSKYEDIHENILFTEGQDKNYSLTIDLKANAEFKVLTLGYGWDSNLLSSADLAATDTDKNVNLATQVGDNSGNIKILADGKYKIDLVYDSEGDKYAVEIVRTGECELEWEYDIYVHHGVGSDWGDVRLGDVTLNKDKLTLTGDWVVDADSVNHEFGIITSATGGTAAQVGWGGKDKITATAVSQIDTTGGNAKVTAAGTYNITVTLDVEGEFASVVFNSFTAAA